MTKYAKVGNEDSMSPMIRMVEDLKYKDLPGDIVRYAKQQILDQWGVTIGGSGLEGIPALVELLRDRGGKPESLLPFYGGKYPAPGVALALGPMARAMDFGTAHEEAGHNSEYNLPPLLAATGLRDKVTGKEFITAFVAAQEVFTRIGIADQAVRNGAPVGRSGGHMLFGPVAGVGKLLGLTQNQLEDAEGISSEMTQPHSQAMYNAGSLIIRVHHGFIAQDAINCCVVARKGISGPHLGVLDAPQGFLGFYKWETRPEALLDNLGEKWEFPFTMYKPYSCCKCTHTANYGLMEQMKEHRFTAKDIASMHIEADGSAWRIVCLPHEQKWAPHTTHECQFSMPYTMAAAAFGLDLYLDSFSAENRARKDIRELMTRITVSEDPNLPPWANRVHTTLKNGTKYVTEVLYPKGHPKNQFTEPELVEKFKKCAKYGAVYKLSQKVIDSLAETILNLEQADDVVKALIEPVTPK